MRTFCLLTSSVLLLSMSSVSTRQTNLLAERIVDYRVGRVINLGATAGPVRIASVEFSDLGRGYGQGGIASRLRGGGTDSEASTTIRAHFLAENPVDDEWAVTFTLEFLDRNEAVIEKVTKRTTWEGEAKPYDFEHTILAYVIPMIDKVRIKMEGRLD